MEESVAQARIDLRARTRIDRAPALSVAARLAIAPDAVFLASGREAALLTLLHVLADAGDELLVPSPIDPTHAELATVSALHLASFALVPGDAWTVDARALFDAPTERTRAVVIGRPATPSGIVVDVEALEVLAELGLPVVCDESALAASRRSLACEPWLTSERAPLLVIVGAEEGRAFVGVRGPEDLAGPLARRLGGLEPTLLGAPRSPVDAARVGRNAEAMRALLDGTPCVVPAIETGSTACIGLRGAASSVTFRARLSAEGVLVDAVEGLVDLEHAWISVSLDADEPSFAEAMRGVASLARQGLPHERISPIEGRGPRRIGEA